MSESIKLKNNKYWDTKGIVHDKTLLSDILNKLNYQYVSSGDFNNLIGSDTIQPTCYAIYGNLSNAPEGYTVGWLESYYQSPNTQVQKFTANNGNIFIRRKSGGVWASWKAAFTY